MALRPYQQQAIEDLREKFRSGVKRVFYQLATGGGKCLGKGTPVLMYDGSIKPVESVVVGDKLMGPDSTMRRVLSTCVGEENLYRVTPVKGDPYVVNESHILSLKKTGIASNPKYPSQRLKGHIVNISVRDYLEKSKTFKHTHKGWRSGVDFENTDQLPPELPPYMLGLWLGDGSSRGSEITTADSEVVDYIESFCAEHGANLRVDFLENNQSNVYCISTAWQRVGSMLSALRRYKLIKNKHIPRSYKTASREDRLELLAGLMDSDGSLHRTGFDYTTKLKTLADDIAFVARSVGFAAYVKQCEKKCYNNGVVGTYWRIMISGDGVEVPVKIERKKAPERKQKKSHLVTGIRVEPIGRGEYFGFEIDGDRLFMLGDFTVTHNTVIFTEITRLAFAKDLRVWIVVPRRKLLRQASAELSAMKIPHGRINADCKESLAYRVHAVSRDTLMRRISSGKVKRFPDIIILDEAHTGLDQQIRIFKAAPEGTIFVGCSATPERADGRGLKQCPALYAMNPDAENGLYEDIVYGPDFSWLVSADYLSKMQYFCPPGFDTSQIKKKGADYDPESIEALLASRQVYGSAIAHYKELGRGKPALIFCPSVKNSEETALRFRDAGFKFESIDGSMTDKKLDTILDALAVGGIDGVCSCDIATYGLNIPAVSYIGMLRKTMSRALYFQILGRGTRPEKDKMLIVADHVGNFRELATGAYVENDPLEKCFDIEWNFCGVEKNKKGKGEVVASLKICDNCFLWYAGSSCCHCGTERNKKPTKRFEEIEGRLIEVTGPVKMKDRPAEEQREVQDKIGMLIEQTMEDGEYKITGPVLELLDLAADLGHDAMWVYWRLSEGMKAVNVPLLHAIRQIKGYKSGWTWMQQKTIKARLGR